jgi:tetratricopeptide (TPR) repeat protein
MIGRAACLTIAIGVVPVVVSAQPAAHQLCRQIVGADSTVAAAPAIGRALLSGCREMRDRAWDRAVADFERAVAEDSSDAVNHFWLARGYGERARRMNPLRAAGMFPRIRSHVNRAIALDPGYVDARVLLIEMLLRAPAIMGGSIDGASEQVRLLGQVNAYAGALAGTRVAFARGDSAGAEQALRALTRSHADSAAAYVSLMTHLFAHGRTSEVAILVVELERSARLAPMSEFYRGQLAAVTSQNLEVGGAALRRYVARRGQSGFPSFTLAHLHLSRVLSLQGRLTEARAALAEAMRLDPDLEEARRDLEQLDKRRPPMSETSDERDRLSLRVITRNVHAPR